MEPTFREKEEFLDGAPGALEAFFGQFGSMDIYAKIVIEEILKELIHADEKQE